MKRTDSSARFAERVLKGVDDGGAEEQVVIWVERRAGAVWAVGRTINANHRSTDVPRSDDYLFEGYELDDALAAANEALEDDVRVLEEDGWTGHCKPFTRDEMLRPLERWFFGRR